MAYKASIRLKARQNEAQGAVLLRWLEGVVLPGFADRVLAPDADVARRCSALHVPDPASERDAWIAATALQHGLTVVTHNVADFERTRVKLLNPWD